MSALTEQAKASENNTSLLILGLKQVTMILLHI